jgi:serine/threonine protein kinase
MIELQRRQIAHRDLKPENVLLDATYEAKIGDFGSSKFVSPDSWMQQSSVMRTSTFQVPEILRSDEFTWPVDVYADGILFNATLACQIPYENMRFANIFALRKQMKQGTPPTMPIGIDANWKQLIENCWDSDPSYRPPFEAIVSSMSTREFFNSEIDAFCFLDSQAKVAPPELYIVSHSGLA